VLPAAVQSDAEGFITPFPSSIIARPFPPGDYSDPTKIRSVDWIIRDTPFGYRRTEHQRFVFGLCFDGAYAPNGFDGTGPTTWAVDDILRGYVGGEIMLAVRSEAGTFQS
jgi:hypothetical protein